MSGAGYRGAGGFRFGMVVDVIVIGAGRGLWGRALDDDDAVVKVRCIDVEKTPDMQYVERVKT